MKLSFLGPAPPFRGGIVTYFGMLARVLKKRGHDIYWASFLHLILSANRDNPILAQKAHQNL